MQIPALHRAVSAESMPLEKLANSTQITELEKIGEISRQFEAVLLRQILGQAQKPAFKSAFVESGGASKAIYQDMVTEQLADRISRGGSFGFASVLEKQLSSRYIKKEPTNPMNIEGAKQIKTRVQEDSPAASAATKPRPQPGKRI